MKQHDLIAKIDCNIQKMRREDGDPPCFWPLITFFISSAIITSSEVRGSSRSMSLGDAMMFKKHLHLVLRSVRIILKEPVTVIFRNHHVIKILIDRLIRSDLLMNFTGRTSKTPCPS